MLVIGSQSPWLESILISKGARLVTTFDYIRIVNEHPNIETLLPTEMSKKYEDGVRFDVMITFSSIEHSGLGRSSISLKSLKCPHLYLILSKDCSGGWGWG